MKTGDSTPFGDTFGPTVDILSFRNLQAILKHVCET